MGTSGQFDGFLKDDHFPELRRHIAIDRFTAETSDCTHFFLSHAHSDHMVGLIPSGDNLSSCFSKTISSNPNRPIRLYCTLITKEFLKIWAPFISSKIDGNIILLDIDRSIDLPPIELCENGVTSYTHVTVTSLDTPDHCPGAVMYLFEYSSSTDSSRPGAMVRRSLYSGDFRFQATEPTLDHLPDRLKTPDGTVLPINVAYLDTTFAYRPTIQEVGSFPDQSNSVEVIVSLIKEWQCIHRETSSKLKVLILMPAKCGMENLFIRLKEEFRQPVRLYDEKTLAQYGAQLEELEKVASSVAEFGRPSSTEGFIYACGRNPFVWKNCYEKLTSGPRNEEVAVKIIFPTAKSFTEMKERDDLDMRYYRQYGVLLRTQSWRYTDGSAKDVHKVFYSSHCSLHELRRYVQLLRPQKVVPNVIPKGTDEGTIVGLLTSRRSPSIVGDDGDLRTTSRMEAGDTSRVSVAQVDVLAGWDNSQ